MNYRDRMNEILRGNTDVLARKYIGRSADNMRMKEKEKILADIYMSFNDELKKNKKVKSDVALRREQIDNEMKNIRNGDRDELLGAHIKNYDPSISVEKKDEILGQVYDSLTEERKKLDKEPTIITPPEAPENPKLTTLPDESVTVGAEVKPLSNTSGYSDEKRTPRGMTDLDIEANMKEILHGDTDTFLENNAEMYGFVYDPDMSAVEKEDILGCIYDILTEERRKLKAGEYDVKPENPSVEEDNSINETKALEEQMSYLQTIDEPVNEKTTEADIRQQALNSTDIDTFLENHQEVYGYNYHDNMSESEKTDLYRNVKSLVEDESNAAQLDAKGLWDAEQALAWINEHVYNNPNDLDEAYYRYGEINEFEQLAWGNYYQTGNEIMRGVAVLWGLVAEKYYKDNLENADKSTIDSWIEKIPEYKDMVKYGTPTALMGFGTGALKGAVPGSKSALVEGAIGALKGFTVGSNIVNEKKENGQALKVLIDAGVPDDVAIKAIREGDGTEQITEVLVRIAGRSASKLVQNALVSKVVSLLSSRLGDKMGNEIGERLTETYLNDQIVIK